MFQRTLRNLTLLISLVFLLIFIAFTSTIYGYISVRLFDKVDDAMRIQVQSFRLTSGRASQVRARPLFDPRIFVLLRSDDGRIANLSAFRTEEQANLLEIASQIKVGELETKEYENHVYRILSVPYLYDEKMLRSEERFVIKEVIAVSIVDSEIGLLNYLLWIIIGGLIVGMAAIIAAGYYLAKRAMVPIEAAWEKQQRFVADASHELRSPITGIHSNAELMLRHPSHSIEQESHRVHTIMKESIRMTKLISSLLTLARSDANITELQLAEVNVSELIEIVADHFRPLVELKQIALHVTITSQLQLVGDKERLHQLFVILLDNAVKYTPKGGEVAVTGTRVDKSIVVSVQDTGCGIQPGSLPHIFDRFFREDKARSRDSGGIGLGLAIAQWIVEMHGGKISAQSEPGKGSTFKVVLPIIKISR